MAFFNSDQYCADSAFFPFMQSSAYATMPIEIDSGPTRPSVTKMGIAADAEGFFLIGTGLN